MQGSDMKISCRFSYLHQMGLLNEIVISTITWTDSNEQWKSEEGKAYKQWLFSQETLWKVILKTVFRGILSSQ